MFVSYVPRLLFPILLLFCIFDVMVAQEPEFVLDSSVEYAFGQELRFSINVQNAADIEKLSLSLRPELSPNWYIVDVPFEAGEMISVTHKINVDDVNLKPYSQVNYHIEVHTTGGETYKSPQGNFGYEDDRFDWQQMPQDGIAAHWTGGGPSFGQDILIVVNEALTRLAAVLPLDYISPFDVYVYPSAADLRAGLRLAGLSGETFSHPELGVILVTAVNPQSALTELGQSLPYELSHLLLYRAAGENFDNIPWWLAEGLGTLVQVEPHPRYQQLLNDAIKTGETIPIRQLCQKTERIDDRDLLSSAQSNSLVNFILQRYGDATLVNLISTYIQGDSCETGVKRSIGISLDELDEAWQADQQAPSVLPQLFADYGLWLLLLLTGTGFMVYLIWQTWHEKRSE